jgi:hypothetical protein
MAFATITAANAASRRRGCERVVASARGHDERQLGHHPRLDVAGGSTSDVAGVIQWYESFAGDSRWNLVDQGDGTETIVNQNSGKCLTTVGVPGHQLYQSPCSGSALQKWQGAFGSRSTGTRTSSTLPVLVEVARRAPLAGQCKRRPGRGRLHRHSVLRRGCRQAERSCRFDPCDSVS